MAYPDAQRSDVGCDRRDDTHAWTGGAPCAGPQHGLAHHTLCRVLDVIHGRLGEKVTLQDIADAASMSRFHFARLFRRSTGRSPMEYLLHVRLERAKALLRRGGMPISDIAVAIGFADQSHFTRHFRRAIGTTPRRYARQDTDTSPPLVQHAAAE